MRPRFPLYLKILLWFFLNLTVLAAVVFLAFRVQFRLGLDWILAGGTADRIEAVSHLIAMELNERPRREWTSVVERFSSAYHMAFLAFDQEGQQLAGAPTELPVQVKARLVQTHRLRQHPQHPRRPPRAPLPETRRPEQPSEAMDGRDTPPPPPPPYHLPAAGGRLPKSIIRSTSPTRYWVLVDLELPPLEKAEPRPVVLVAMTESLTGGGLLFDAKPWLIAGAGVLLISALLWLPFVSRITRSVAQMTHATGQIAQGRFDVRVDAGRTDELGDLGRGINQMAGRLAGFVSGQKRFLSDVAHELCSPLARLQVSLGILEQRASDAQRPYVDGARAKAEEIAALVNELLSFSKASLAPAKVALGPVRLRDIVQKAILREHDSSGSIELDVPERLLVLAEPELLLRAVSNLLRNAIAYAGKAGPIRVGARQESGA